MCSFPTRDLVCDGSVLVLFVELTFISVPFDMKDPHEHGGPVLGNRWLPIILLMFAFML
jgi:hypothetical protein